MPTSPRRRRPSQSRKASVQPHSPAKGGARKKSQPANSDVDDDDEVSEDSWVNAPDSSDGSDDDSVEIITTVANHNDVDEDDDDDLSSYNTDDNDCEDGE